MLKPTKLCCLEYNEISVQPDANEFALEPIIVIAGDETSRRAAPRKRRLIVDDAKVIASETMKRHIGHTADIVHVLDLAPPRKQLMLWKEFGCVEKLLVIPGKPLLSRHLAQVGSNHGPNRTSRFWCVLGVKPTLYMCAWPHLDCWTADKCVIFPCCLYLANFTDRGTAGTSLA